ncbi:MAG: type I glyceraldehyde-3-phosphate dehydrogenase, partial [Candidatus Paceibacterota bacterium]
NKDPRRGRAAAENMIPTTTGAAIATTKVIPDLVDKFDGIAVRVPTPAGSIADITFVASRDTSAEEVNDILRSAARDERWSKTFTVTEEPLVSSDIVGMNFGAIADLAMTRVTGGNLVKVMSWYDNEAGYTHTLVEHVIATGRHI